jgi:hypothetical protein
MRQGFTIDIQAPSNGRPHKATVHVRDGGDTVRFTDRADMMDARERRKLANRIADRLEEEPAAVAKKVEEGWNEVLTRREQAEREAAERAGEETPLPEDCPWRGVRLPADYRITADGCVEDLGGDDGPRLLTRGPVWVEAFARDYRCDDWGYLLVWRDRDGQTHRGAFPAGRFHEQSSSLAQELAGGGLAVVPGQERALIRYLAAFDATRRVRAVDRLGWADVPAVPGVPAVPVYVFQDRVIGDAGAEEPVYRPAVRSTLVAVARPAGTLEQWQGRVAAKALGNPVLVFSVSLAFAGPLLWLAGVEGGGFNLYGGSSKGKTTAAQLAASVWGCGADPAEAPGGAFLRKWNATHNAIEAIAAEHCDSLLPLDEIGEAQAQDPGRVIYQLAGGQGKSRLSRGASLRRPRTWRTVIFSTGEVPIQSVIESTGRRARGGQLVRMVDIPATGEDGDIIHDPQVWEPAEFVHRLKRACGSRYGTAGPAFVDWLCRRGAVAELSRMVQDRLADAHALLVPPGAPEEVSRVVRRFALVLVAGQLACEAEVLLFRPRTIRNAVRLVLRRWLDAHGPGPMERAVEQLRAFLLSEQARFRDRDNVTDHAPRDLVGYRDESQGLFLLTPDGAKEALEGFSVRDVMRHLRGRGWLFTNEGDRLLSGHRVRDLNRVVRLYAVRDAVLGEAAPAEAEGDGYEPGCRG